VRALARCGACDALLPRQSSGLDRWGGGYGMIAERAFNSSMSTVLLESTPNGPAGFEATAALLCEYLKEDGHARTESVEDQPDSRR